MGEGESATGEGGDATRGILVTGGAGFIGSNFIKFMLERQRGRVVNLDALTYAGNLANLDEIKANPAYTFIRGDIGDGELLDSIFSRHAIDTVVNFAAESHVDRSIETPNIFLVTNVLGTQVLLDAARKHWNLAPGDKYSRQYRAGVKFLQVSTDEVYGALGQTGKFAETTPLAPNSPYSASKAAADLLARSYHETFGLPVNITRCSNNYGPYQFPEKLIPLMINNCLREKALPVYGDGMQIRDWLHVHDHCAAIDTVLSRGRDGEIYNIGGDNEKANMEIVRLIIRTLGKSESLITYVKDRPGHDRRYAIDNTKITGELGWSPAYTFERGIRETVEWYLARQDWMSAVTSGAYRDYYAGMYEGASVS
ncbi:MAG: dTDP-glucose 4,6-dehydratase [Peptococcaceae bacterium]|jgi:dTDP-glucose 4,6-dehydratase|nr:dTDP-glucose 4,6-dehydratase [Peptococcaceae bacterium]